jgi:hypothetical protein
MRVGWVSAKDVAELLYRAVRQAIRAAKHRPARASWLPLRLITAVRKLHRPLFWLIERHTTASSAQTAERGPYPTDRLGVREDSAPRAPRAALASAEWMARVETGSFVVDFVAR